MKLNLKSTFFIFVISFSSIFLFAQTVRVPIDNSIYNFMERLSIKGIIKFTDEVKPLSRLYISNKLQELKSKENLLTELEKVELDFYLKEYYAELIIFNGNINSKNLEYLEFGKSDRLRAFFYYDNNFVFTIDPIAGYNFNSYKNKLQIHRWGGLQGWGYIKNNFAFSFDFRDNMEKGDYIDRVKNYSPFTGIVISRSEKSIEYAEVRASISYDWNWGGVQFGKDFINIGSGKNGQIILSNKAPSFPFLRLTIEPVDWFRFNYLYGWLHSNILDSASLRKTSVEGRDNLDQISKFIVLHNLSFDLTNNLTFSLGESVVFSGGHKAIYLIPIIFFRLADHYEMRENSNSGDNAQLFSNVSYNIPAIKSKFYGTVFIDELAINRILKGEYLAAIAYTLGLKLVDPIWKNSDFTFEYTKVNPFVYMNSNEAETYSSHDYQLGHWIGSNADQLYFEFNQRLFRGFTIKSWVEFSRKGQKELPIQQYQMPYPKTLFGLLRKDFKVGISISYELLHDFYLRGSFQYSEISDEDIKRTEGYLLGRNKRLSFSFHYGF